MKRFFINCALLFFVTTNFFANEIDDKILEMIKSELNQYGGKTVLVDSAFRSENFIINISNCFIETLGIKEKGYVFKKLLMDDNYYLVIYHKNQRTNYKSETGNKIYNMNDDLLFVILIDKIEYKFITAYYM